MTNQKVRECKFNCKSEGPPGPIWCRECGHAPECCNCVHPDDYQQEKNEAFSKQYAREGVIGDATSSKKGQSDPSTELKTNLE